MKKFIIFLLILILTPLALLAYLGVIPAFAKYVAAPQDLGVKVDKTLVSDLEAKYAPAKNGSGRLTLKEDFSSQAITSVFAVWQERDPYFPLKDVQVRFSKDGTGEASGLVRIDTAISLAKRLGYSDSDIASGKEYLKYVSGDLPFYLTGTGGMQNNHLTISPRTFKIGRVTVPDSITSPLSRVVSDMITRRISQIGGADVRDANFKDGTFHLDATVPDTIRY